MTDQFQFNRYIVEGDKAIHLHPDVEQIDYGSAASDMIASILHAVFDRDDGPMEDGIDPQGLLDRALRCYLGDQEDREADEAAMFGDYRRGPLLPE